MSSKASRIINLNVVFDTKVSNEVGREFLCAVFVFFFIVNIYFLIGFYSLYKNDN